MSSVEAFLEWMGDKPIPDPLHQPKLFRHYVTLFLHSTRK